MRIMLLTQIVPYPPDAGPKIKTYNVLRYLCQRHEIDLVSFSRSEAEEASARALASLCSSVTTVPIARSRARDMGYMARSLAGGRPFLIERDDSQAMRGAIQRLLHDRSFDAVHADQLSMAQFAVDLPVPLRVLDEHNAVWTIVRRAAATELAGPARVAAELEWRKLRAYEGELCALFDLVTVVSSYDYLALAEAAGGIFPAKVIPIAVDCQDMAFQSRSDGARDILSVATMFYPPNVEAVHWFATQVFPLVRRAVPECRFVIVGSRPPKRICSLAGSNSGIVVTGYVPDLSDIFARSALTVVPVRSGSGMRVKILEAFARGIPVVSTSVGMEGIEAKPGVHLLVSDAPAAFAESVTTLLQEPHRARAIAETARSLVEDRYDWRTALRPLDEIYPCDREPMSQATLAPKMTSRESEPDPLETMNPVDDLNGSRGIRGAATFG